MIENKWLRTLGEIHKFNKLKNIHVILYSDSVVKILLSRFKLYHITAKV